MNSHPPKSPRRRGRRSALVGLLLSLSAAAGFVAASPTAAGWLMVRLGVVRAAPAAAFRQPPPSELEGLFRVQEPAEWPVDDRVRALRAQYQADEETAGDTPITFTFLYDLPPTGNRAICGDGFALLIEGLEKTILYDAGLNPGVLEANAHALGKSLAEVEVLIVSHTSEDHLYGIKAFGDVPTPPVIYYPAGVAPERKALIEQYSPEVREVKGPTRLMRGVYTTGPAPHHPELALVIATPQGPVHLVSCAHIGRVPFLDQALALAGKRLYLDIGGYCPLWSAPYQVQMERWRAVRERDPRYIAFCHCAPDGVRRLAAVEWPGRDVYVGGGTVITIPAGAPAPPEVRR